MIATLVHRGPDDGGVWIDPAGRCVLGHRRLSIIDTSEAGRQPMASADDRWVITFNGEIYNFKDVRQALSAEGVNVRGRTDTEVLVESVALWGVEALAKLDGMFAFAAFNRESGELFLARDPFGEKPLYYVELGGGGLAFSSELQALERLPGFDDEVSVDAMAEVLMFQYIGAPRTIYRAVRKLAPGHCLSIRPGEDIRVARYFEFLPGVSGFDNRPLSEQADELEEILVRSICRRLISDVPLGAFLSGGVDSSTVCALIRKKLGVPLKTFSIGFEGAPESEHEAARAFARHLGTEHYDQVLTPDMSEFLIGIGGVLDEPNADSSCMPTYLLSRFTRQRVTVALSGDGGDELFAGYGRYFTTLDEAAKHEKRRSITWQPGNAYYSDRILVSTERYIEELFGVVPEGLMAHLSSLRTQLNQEEVPLLCRLRKTDVDNYMPGAVLPKVDRMSMRHSLEVRTPFLNVELARFSERLSPNSLYRDGRGKIILRELAYRYLPRRLIDAPKRGFGIPMVEWGRDALLRVASSLLASGDSRLRDFLGPDAVDRFLKRQRSAGGFSTYQVWALTMVESWLRHHKATLPRLERERSGRGATVPAPYRRPVSAKSLFAWQLDAGLFAVLENGSTRLDGSQPVSNADMAHQAEIAANVLRMVLCSRSSADASADSVQWRTAEPMRLPGWGEASIRDQDGRFLGATLIFPEPNAGQFIDARELRKFEQMGVKKLVFAHRFRYGGSLVSLTLRRLSWLERLIAVARLSRYVVGRIDLRCRIRALARYKLAPRRAKWRIDVGPFPGIEGAADTELSDRYMVFEGMRQLPPLPVSHEEIGRLGGGRYSIWSRQCVFSPSRAINLLLPYWIVPCTPATEPHLQLIPKSFSQGVRDDGGWTTKIRNWIADWERAALTTDAPLEEFRLSPADSIVVLTHALPPGGAERQWCYLAIGLKEAGFAVTFVTIEPLRDGNSHYLPLLLKAGIEVVDISQQALSEVLHYLPRDAAKRSVLSPNPNPFHASLDLLTSFLARKAPKVVFAQLDSPNLIAATAAHLAGVPRVILSFRNYNPTHFSYLRNDWFKECYQAVCKSPRVLLSGNATSCNEDYANWIGIPPERIRWIPNAIDPTEFGVPSEQQIRQLRHELNVTEGTPVVLGVFRLSEEKRPLVFVEVISRLTAYVKRLRVLVVGIGPMREQMEQAIEESQLKAVVSLLGSRHDVATLMNISSLLLLTSSHEGMPNVIMEAQVSGLPVVATRVGGVPDLVVDGDTGFVASCDDIDAMVHGCTRLLTDAALLREMGKRSVERVLREFSRTSMVNRYLALADPERYGVAPSRHRELVAHED